MIHHEADHAQPLADEMMMHRRAGEQRRHGNVLHARAPIGEDDDVDAFAHRGLGARAQGFECVLEPRGSLLGRPGRVEECASEMAAADLGHRADLSRSALVRMGWRSFSRLRWESAFDVEQVGPRPDDRHEAHDQLLADRIDRRVGHLGEVLLEMSEQKLRLARQREMGVSLPMEPTASSPATAMGDMSRAEVLLAVAEGLLAIEQREVESGACSGAGGRSSNTIWVRSRPLL